MKSADRVVVSWIDPGQVEGLFACSLVELVKHPVTGKRIEAILRIEGSLLSRQRNEIVRHFLDDLDTAWLLMLDSDEQITPQVFEKLVSVAHEKDRPVVAGLYFGTWPGNLMPKPVPHLYRAADDGVTVIPVLDYPPDTVIQVDAAGTGCLLVHRSVLERMREETADEHTGRDWCWFRDLPLEGLWLGEDLYFCRRIRALGIPIHAHTGAILQHRRRYWLDERQFEAARQFEKETIMADEKQAAAEARAAAAKDDRATPPAEDRERDGIVTRGDEQGD